MHFGWTFPIYTIGRRRMNEIVVTVYHSQGDSIIFSMDEDFDITYTGVEDDMLEDYLADIADAMETLDLEYEITVRQVGN